MLDDVAVRSLFNQLSSHAMSLGLFDRVATHEPKNAPGNGLTCVFWAHEIQPVAAASGLAATSIRLQVNCRIYSNALSQPLDATDPNVVAAVATLMGEYGSNFTLGGQVRDVDVLGQHGEGLYAQAGYISQDGRMYRVMELVLPLIINDAFGQVP